MIFFGMWKECETHAKDVQGTFTTLHWTLHWTLHRLALSSFDLCRSWRHVFTDCLCWREFYMVLVCLFKWFWCLARWQGIPQASFNRTLRKTLGEIAKQDKQNVFFISLIPNRWFCEVARKLSALRPVLPRLRMWVMWVAGHQSMVVPEKLIRPDLDLWRRRRFFNCSHFQRDQDTGWCWWTSLTAGFVLRPPQHPACLSNQPQLVGVLNGWRLGSRWSYFWSINELN